MSVVAVSLQKKIRYDGPGQSGHAVATARDQLQRRSGDHFFFSSRRRHTRWPRDWSSDVCSSDLTENEENSTCICYNRKNTTLLPGFLHSFLPLRGVRTVSHSRIVCSLLCFFFAMLFPVRFIRAENWPQWRGPNGDGISSETNLPAHWSATENVAWSLPLPGMGGSTPIVWGERIFLTSADAGNDLWLLCISTDGKELWRRKLGNLRLRKMTNEGNGASASPSTDGKYIWAFVGSGDFACFDFDGREKWRFNAQERYGKFNIQFGMHTTPVLYGDRLYLQLLHSGGAWVIALDKNTGETVWKVERRSDGVAECEHSYASPCIWHNGDKAYLITHGCDYAIAHRLENGEEIWRLGDLNPKDRYNRTLRFVASPVAAADLIVVPTAKNGPVVGVKPTATGMIRSGSSNEMWRRSS